MYEVKVLHEVVENVNLIGNFCEISLKLSDSDLLAMSKFC